ncbi:CocE/NonD family hydrolase [Streptomyces iranensis]|uniref:Hydrolase CocE/NonD family protein n=2 Tax=Streptomyces iranensis TaxID=576784 RepID=A0A060ZU38_9ACTN|nr:hydrolase CocE/NonD family protein [Streptomyces iranensis]
MAHMRDQPAEVDGITIDWDAPIRVSDGTVLRADVFRPTEPGDYPVILAMGPYGKGLHLADGYPANWRRMHEAYPEVAHGSTGRYQNWEMADPEKWVPDGYVCVRVDSRGSGRSPGFMDVLTALQARDLYECIEWAGQQEWSNGKVGLLGISYFAANQWQVAALRPPHLAAICVWEGFADHYREGARHGGITCEFVKGAQARQMFTVQYGMGSRGPTDRNTGRPVAGDVDLDDDVLRQNRRDLYAELLARPVNGEFYQERSADLSRIEVPLLSAGNWGGMGLHLRGNVEGFLAAGSELKWLEMHGDTHFNPFYNDRGLGLQKQFFGTFLKGEQNSWLDRPPVELLVRHPGERFEPRFEQEWPIARTEWTEFHLCPETMELRTSPGASGTLSYQPEHEDLRFRLPPAGHDREFTGPAAAKLRISSATADADLFLSLRLYDPQGTEVTFIGSNDPKVPIALGWLRASHRRLDTDRSEPYRPVHSHDTIEFLVPGEPVDVDIEIWPTSIVVPAGYVLELGIGGRDYSNQGTEIENAMYPTTGVGPFIHTDPEDRPAEIFGGTVTLHFGPDVTSYLLLPAIPAP